MEKANRKKGQAEQMPLKDVPLPLKDVPFRVLPSVQFACIQCGTVKSVAQISPKEKNTLRHCEHCLLEYFIRWQPTISVQAVTVGTQASKDEKKDEGQA